MLAAHGCEHPEHQQHRDRRLLNSQERRSSFGGKDETGHCDKMQTHKANDADCQAEVEKAEGRFGFDLGNPEGSE